MDAAASTRDGAGRADSPCEPATACGRAALLGFVSSVSFRLRRHGRETAAKWRAGGTAKPCGPGRRCYGQAVAEVCASPTGQTASSIREAREARRKVRLPGEHGIS